jgi:hypothetical protein
MFACMFASLAVSSSTTTHGCCPAATAVCSDGQDSKDSGKQATAPKGRVGQAINST